MHQPHQHGQLSTTYVADMQGRVRFFYHNFQNIEHCLPSDTIRFMEHPIHSVDNQPRGYIMYKRFDSRLTRAKASNALVMSIVQHGAIGANHNKEHTNDSTNIINRSVDNHPRDYFMCTRFDSRLTNGKASKVLSNIEAPCGGSLHFLSQFFGPRFIPLLSSFQQMLSYTLTLAL